VTDKSVQVSALMTAESVIAGFMIAYAALGGQNLLHWADPSYRGSPLTTFVVGLFVYAIVLTCFRSLLLLFQSIKTSETNQTKYEDGYELFLAAILGSGIFVILNVLSTYHFTVRLTTFEIPNDFVPAVCTVFLIVFFGYVAVLLHRHRWVQRLGRILECRPGRRITDTFLLITLAAILVVVLILGY
jgi:hypothetical protein